MHNSTLNNTGKHLHIACPQESTQCTFVTEFWKITHMVMPEIIRIFEFSMTLLIAETTFKNISKLYL